MRADSTQHKRPASRLEIAALIGACGVGLLLRALNFPVIFPAEGDVLLGLDDAQFHARRALYSFVNFPAVLDFDWFLAFPDGAAAPVPPFFDWATAGVARLFGDDIRTLETVAAWVSPVAGALLAWPAYAIGCAVATRGVGLGAAWLSALLPSGALITRLGNFDHHGAVALIAACWLWVSLSIVGRSGRALAARAAVQAGVIALMLFTWSGSLLYLAVGAGAQLMAILLLHGRAESLLAVGASLLAVAVPSALWLANSSVPLGGAFSSQTLSWLHVLALCGIGIPTLLLAQWQSRKPAAGPVGRVGRFALLAGAIGIPLLALPALREQLLQGVYFLAQQDDWALTNPEQFPLFHSKKQAAVASVRLGYFAYLVPLLPFYLGWKIARSEEAEKFVVLLVWVSALTLLLLSQVRYGTDFTVPGSVVFAMILAEIQRGLSQRLPARLATAAVVVLTAAALFTAIQATHQPVAKRTLSQLLAEPTSGARSAMTPHEIAVQFGRQVREVTPEAAGFLEPGIRPEYGILVPPHLGHRFTYTARRPVPSNNLGPYLDFEKYRFAKDFYEAMQQLGAMKSVDALGVRYVVSTARDWKPLAFADHLHARNESSVRGRPTTGRLRLVAAAAPIKKQKRTSGRSRKMTLEIPFKLFEVVAGAQLVVEAEAGSKVSAKIQLIYPQEGKVFYTTVGTAGADGIARLRVPYATRQRGAISTQGPWWVKTADRRIAYWVDEPDVREGREVRAPEDIEPSASGSALDASGR
ncbi:MAG: hypothetical protein AAEJ53_16745 [Myxococcota bacterium]